MMRRFAAKLEFPHRGSRLINTLRRMLFLIYIFVWSLICFGFSILRMLIGKIIFAVMSVFSRQSKTRQRSREDSTNKSNDQIAVISKQNGD